MRGVWCPGVLSSCFLSFFSGEEGGGGERDEKSNRREGAVCMKDLSIIKYVIE